VGLRWRAAREALTSTGAQPDALDAVEGALASDHAEGVHGLAVFANSDGAAHVEALPRPPATGADADFGPLPHVMPMLWQRGEQVSWLRVMVDRTGADIERAAVGRSHRFTSVEGSESYPIGKRKAGGWSTRRYQDAAEVTWERNTENVAEAAAKLAAWAGAEVLIVAGDVRARQLMIEQMPKVWRERIVESDGSRAPGADPHRLDEQTHRAVAEVARCRIETALDRFRVQSAHDTAVAGLVSAVTALQRGTAEALLVEPSALDGTKLWVGPEPELLATTEGELASLGVARPQNVRADDAMLRATVATGAELFLIEREQERLADGVAVLLRNNPP
jgi:Bacterial archaeo-eukaryotic release factor family 2